MTSIPSEWTRAISSDFNGQGGRQHRFRQERFRPESQRRQDSLSPEACSIGDGQRRAAHQDAIFTPGRRQAGDLPARRQLDPAGQVRQRAEQGRRGPGPLVPDQMQSQRREFGWARRCRFNGSRHQQASQGRAVCLGRHPEHRQALAGPMPEPVPLLEQLDTRNRQQDRGYLIAARRPAQPEPVVPDPAAEVLVGAQGGQEGKGRQGQTGTADVDEVAHWVG